MLKKKYLSSAYSKGFFSLLKGTFWAQLLGFVGTLYIAKIYGSNDFGTFSKFLSLTTILTIFFTFRLESTLILYDKKERIFSLFSTIIKIVFLTSISTFLIVVLLPDNIFIKINFLKFIVFASIFGAIIKSLESVYINYLIKEKQFKIIAKSKVLFVVLRYALQISFFFLLLKEGLLIGFIIASLLMLFYLIKKAEIKYIKTSWQETKSNIKENLNLVSFGFLSDNLNTVNLNIIPVIAGIYFKDSIIGLYFLAITILSVTLTLVSSSFTKVFFLKTANLYNTQKEKLFPFIKKSTFYLTLILCLPMLFFVLFGEYFIESFFDEKWQKAGTFIKYLAFLFFLRGVYNPLSNLEEVYRKNHVGFLFNLYLFGVNLIAIFFGNLENDFLLLLKIVSLFSSFGYIMMIIYFLNYSKKLSFKKLY